MFHRLRKVSHFKVVEPTSRSLIQFSNNVIKIKPPMVLSQDDVDMALRELDNMLAEY